MTSLPPTITEVATNNVDTSKEDEIEVKIANGVEDVVSHPVKDAEDPDLPLKDTETDKKATTVVETIDTEKTRDEKSNQGPFVVNFDSDGWSDSSSSSESSSSESETDRDKKEEMVSEKSEKESEAEKKLDNTAVFSESDEDSSSEAEPSTKEIHSESKPTIDPKAKVIDKVDSSLSEHSSSEDLSDSSSSSSSSSSSDSSSDEDEKDISKPQTDAQSSLRSLLRGTASICSLLLVSGVIPRKPEPVKSTPVVPTPKSRNGPARAFKNIFKEYLLLDSVIVVEIKLQKWKYRLQRYQ